MHLQHGMILPSDIGVVRFLNLLLVRERSGKSQGIKKKSQENFEYSNKSRKFTIGPGNFDIRDKYFTYHLTLWWSWNMFYILADGELGEFSTFVLVILVCIWSVGIILSKQSWLRLPSSVFPYWVTQVEWYVLLRKLMWRNLKLPPPVHCVVLENFSWVIKKSTEFFLQSHPWGTKCVDPEAANILGRQGPR